METNTLPAPVPATLNGNAVALTQPAGNPLLMPVPVEAVIARHEAIQQIISRVFKDGTHYGEIPGTSKDKNGKAKKTLLKPGFDTLCEAFGFSPDYVKQPESVESDKFISIVYKCMLTAPNGRIVATGIGSCNSKEEKYRWVSSARKCPSCGGEFIRTSKPEDKQGFYCWKKLGGCGMTFPKQCPDIENQPEGRKENDNPWNHHNTITKISQKRSGMAAIITACGISGDFTQDVEDFEPMANSKAARGEEGIDVQGQGPPGYENPGWRTRADGDDREFEGGDAHPHPAGETPQDWREDARAAAAKAEDAQFTPAAASTKAEPLPQEEIDSETGLPYSKGIATARAWVKAQLKGVKTDERITQIAAQAHKAGGAYLNAKVGILFKEAREAMQKAGV